MATALKTLLENLELSGEMEAQGEILGTDEPDASGDGEVTLPETLESIVVSTRG